MRKKVGDAVEEGEPLVTMHVNDRRRLDEAAALLKGAFRLEPEAAAPGPLVRAVLD
jgi:thymidine phosphorylase